MEIDWCQHHSIWEEGCKYCGPRSCANLPEKTNEKSEQESDRDDPATDR